MLFRSDKTRMEPIARGYIWACACLAAVIPLIGNVLPEALAGERWRALRVGNISRVEWFYILAPVAVALLARRSWAPLLLALTVVAAGVYVKATAFPILDSEVSARQLWRQAGDKPGAICDGGMGRDWVYGIAFYRGAPLPPCGAGRYNMALRSHGHGPPVLESLQP